MATRTISRRCLQSSFPAPNAAAAFLQLARGGRQLPTPIFDFLAPRAAPIASYIGLARQLRCQASPQLKTSRRPFSTSPARRGTVAVYNPKKDDDGNDMHVEITPRAAKRLQQIMAKDGNPNLALRITVESGGCHGFQYLMSLTTLPPLDAGGSTNANASGSEAEAKLDEDDTVFITDDDSGARIVMDGPSLELLKGSKVDYTMELIGSQFKIVDNPLATSSCGCGTSFDIKA